MFTRRLRLCKCWKVSYAGKVAFQEGGAVGFYSQNGTRCSLGKCCWQQGAARVRSGSRSRLLYNVLSYCSRQRLSWRNGAISRVLRLSLPFGWSQQPSGISPCVALVSANQSKQRCKTGVHGFFCPLTRDLSNRRHQRESEGSESCGSRGGGSVQAHTLGEDQQNARDQTKRDRKGYEAGFDLLLMKVNILPREISVELSQACAAENPALLCLDQL